MAWNANIPATGNQILEDIADIEENLELVIHGDGTEGRVLRCIALKVDDGTNATTLKPSCTSVWNGDAVAEEDNLGHGGDTGNFSLDADGKVLTIEAGGLSGNVIGIVASQIYYNASGAALDVHCTVASNNITVYVRHTTTGADQVMTTLVDTGIFRIQILYITDA
jgi:hypothetical protein